MKSRTFSPYLKLSHGVTVAQVVLVHLVKVRILMGHPIGELPERLKERFAKPSSRNWCIGSNPILSAHCSVLKLADKPSCLGGEEKTDKHRIRG